MLRAMEGMGEIGGIKRNLGARVRELRKQQGLTQERLGLMVGLDRTYIIGIEKGRRNVSIDNLIKLAHGLGVPLHKLFQGIDAFPSKDASSTP